MSQTLSVCTALRWILSGLHKDRPVVRNVCHVEHRPAAAPSTDARSPAGIHKVIAASLLPLLVTLSIVTLPLSAQPTNKKLYCWEQDGRRICSDLLPADAVNHAREEFNAKSGTRSARVERAFNPDALSTTAEEAQRLADEAAAQTRKRTEQAMLLSYDNEDELYRVFRERKDIIENNLQTARFNVSNLREGLLNLLNKAGDHELDGRKVSGQLADDIHQRHRQLLLQRQLQAGYEQQRAALETEIETVIKRYRELKSA